MERVEQTTLEHTSSTAHSHSTAVGVATIEELSGIVEMHEIERLQMAIWSSEPAWVAPSHLLYIIASNGGIVLGARVDGELVGFVFGLLGRRDKKLFHASHMLGIRDDHRGHGIGAALKGRQRERALAQGLTTMIWTFDPLEARNAYFNFQKLGAQSSMYRTDYYGVMRDAINEGLPSDRLLVEWDLPDASPRPTFSEMPRPLLAKTYSSIDLRVDALDRGKPVTIQIPADIHSLRRSDPEAAAGWQLAVRKAFLSAFERGYVAVGFHQGAHILRPDWESRQ